MRGIPHLVDTRGVTVQEIHGSVRYLGFEVVVQYIFGTGGGKKCNSTVAHWP